MNIVRWVAVCTVIAGALGVEIMATEVRVWRADPFRTQMPSVANQASQNTLPSAASPSPSMPVEDRFYVQGIMKMGTSYRAMVANKFVQTGDYLAGYLVKKISKDRIVIQGPGGELRQVVFK